MTASHPGHPADQALLDFLAAQRDAVLSIMAELDERMWQRSVVPSGWTPAGMAEHLAGAERHWFQGVAAGSYAELSWDAGRSPYDPDAAFRCDRPSAEIIGYYRDQCARSDAVLAGTARHAGHLDIARELLDGRTGLGPR